MLLCKNGVDPCCCPCLTHTTDAFSFLPPTGNRRRRRRIHVPVSTFRSNANRLLGCYTQDSTHCRIFAAKDMHASGDMNGSLLNNWDETNISELGLASASHHSYGHPSEAGGEDFSHMKTLDNRRDRQEAETSTSFNWDDALGESLFQSKVMHRKYSKNRFLLLAKLGTTIKKSLQLFFKSEIRQRALVTLLMLIAVRAGHFIPLPGFDRRFMPGDYLAYTSATSEESGEFVSEMRMSLFQLGIGPYMGASIIMQKFAGMRGNCQAGQFAWSVLYSARLQKSFRKYTIIAGSRMDATNKNVQSAMQEVTRHVSLQRRFLFGVLGSVMVAIFVMIGSPSSSSNSTWALTEENLIFLEAWRTIDRAYIDKTFNGQSWFRYREEALRREPMNNREQTYAAIRKMLATLEDPFTRFLEPEKFKSLRTGTRGAVTGVGLEVGFDMSDGVNSNLVVIAPVIGGPAERAGVLPGDVISEIDGIPTKGMSLYDAAQRLQGPESSEVKLTLHNVKGGSPKTLVLVRESIQINPVTWSLCDVAEDGQDPVKIGYIRLATFNENAARSLRDSILKLRENGATAYILDIRNNSGGLFPAGIEIAKLWLEKGVIVYIADNMGIRDIYEADGNETVATSEPLAVLVNKGTASASEILAGALKDNKRAVILGEPTFGKGKIQSVFQLSDGSGMAVTIARYETPAHIDIDKVGITPDHPLPASAPLDKDSFCRCLVDSSLSCHMPPSIFFNYKQNAPLMV